MSLGLIGCISVFIEILTSILISLFIFLIQMLLIMNVFILFMNKKSICMLYVIFNGCKIVTLGNKIAIFKLLIYFVEAL